MDLWIYPAFFIISLLASIIGAICGIGGGVIIKPTLDLFGVASVKTISFLSGCTVLSMSCYSVVKGILSKEQKIDMKVDMPLAIGAVVGGIAGKKLFTYCVSVFPNADRVGAIQAVCLGFVTLGTLLYTIFKNKITGKHVTSPVVGIFLGLALGIMSSFLGIGGGPINLVVLFYFYSMETKKAARSSLYVILFSQAASFIITLVEKSVPEFDWICLLVMVIGGIGGGVLGRKINKKIPGSTVDKLFMGLMGVIILICVYNAIRFSV
ncbi:MAG: sulfite exporter TauE/SafE family protein [Lachnospiraceae bacterium]|nr:sulfite exporter TauE/SafE family protein [Lachnospiraceae bacterium]